ncbi:MAG: DUF2589 domain-containing protein [Alistipes sp.]|nr:DUF2589 domain-containing protein [Alistipes sp.]
MAEGKNIPQTSGGENKKVIINFGGRNIEAVIDEAGYIILPEEIQNILAADNSIIKQATQEAKNEITGNESTLRDDVSDKFRGLPMRDLIGNPLIAAAEAQEKLASTAWDFYHRIAYETDDKGNPTGKTRLVKFKLNRPVVEDGVVGRVVEQTVEAPFIGLVPIPSLLIDRIDIDFQMEVTDTNTEKSSSAAEASTNISAKWFAANVQVAGKVSSARENTRSTNQTAKYQVHVSASQQQQTEGMSKLMDIMAASIEPIPTNGEGR